MITTDMTRTTARGPGAAADRRLASTRRPRRPVSSLARLIVSLGLVLGGAARAQAQAPAELFTPVANDRLADSTGEQSRRLALVRRRPTTQALHLVRINPSALTGNAVRISIPGDRTFDLTKTGGETRSVEDLTWVGTLQGVGGSATLVLRKGDLTGSISSAAGLYRIHPIGGGVHAVVKVNTGRFPRDEPPSFRLKERQRGALRRPTRLDNRGGNRADLGPTQIDVLVAYTAAAKAAVSDIDATITLAVAEANQSYVNSAINIHLNLVDSFQINYQETGKSFDTILADFVARTDVNQRRDQSGADLAALIIDQPAYCGMADAILATAATAFAIVHY